MRKEEILKPNRPIYQLCVNDVRSVIEDDGFHLELNENLILRLEKKVGDYIDWHGIISLALTDYEKSLR
jgi:hypothetical protein